MRLMRRSMLWRTCSVGKGSQVDRTGGSAVLKQTWSSQQVFMSEWPSLHFFMLCLTANEPRHIDQYGEEEEEEEEEKEEDQVKRPRYDVRQHNTPLECPISMERKV